MEAVSTHVFATRPWAFPVSVCAIAVGGSLAYADAPGRFSWWCFILSMIGALLVHAAANLINSYGDFHSGVDVKGSADDRALVDGLVSPQTVYRMIVGCVASASGVLALVCYDLLKRPPPPALLARTFASPLVDLLTLSACGLFLCYAYTAPPFYWKYKGLGDVLMIVGYGPLLVAGGFFCQLGTLPSLSSLLWFGLLPGLLTDGILHVNNTRDQHWDAQCGAVTLPMKLGPRLSRLYFIALYAWVNGVALITALSPHTFLGEGGTGRAWDWPRWLFFLPLLLLPRCVGLIRSYEKGEGKRTLCPECGAYGGLFGLLLSLAIACWRWSAL